MYGIEELKKVVGLIFSGVDALKKTLADGRVELGDLAFLVPLFLMAGPAVKDVGMLPKEISDLSDAEIAELVAYVRSKAPSVSDEHAQEIINASLDVLVAVAEMVNVLEK